ncbi:DUF3231 family protein [Cohnella zeiphila]|uniref:DUF3231 family protein n=1 Tax=Cohnella zeiphila TaxID=2761120 RepID=A0A7X0VY22_9BACL|nr:DUF3231 family protein [Cohnella zeiphila]MBB6734230.1 DUF3231 family protein [Cohnella zeiphila]
MSSKLTSAEIGKLWATYMGNNMACRILPYFLQNVDDRDIRSVLVEGLRVAEWATQIVADLFDREGYPLPAGFSEQDVNMGAPRLFDDEFYPHYLKYTGKAGLSVYGIAIPLVSRPDVRDFFTDLLVATIKLMNDVNQLLEEKGYLIKPPLIPTPKTIDFVEKQSFMNGFFGDVRPLQALEITHIYDNVENNAISSAILTGFCQSAKIEQVRHYFQRGKGIASKHIVVLNKVLQKDDLPSHPSLDHLVTDSTFSPFSDKIMLFHKIDMFMVRIRSYGNALSFSARHDLAMIFARFMAEVGNYVEDGANTMIDFGWMEQPPQAADREALSSK